MDSFLYKYVENLAPLIIPILRGLVDQRNLLTSNDQQNIVRNLLFFFAFFCSNLTKKDALSSISGLLQSIQILNSNIANMRQLRNYVIQKAKV